MRLGISILTHSGHNVWNNGIGQNVYFLAKCLDAIPFIEQVVIIDCGDQNAPPADAGTLGNKFELVRLDDALHSLDVAIEMGGALSATWKAAFRAEGGRVAFHNCGQPYSALIEPSIFGKPGCFVEPDLCDEIWLLAKDRKFTSMQRSLYRCEVHEVPYLWAPDFLIASAQTNPERQFGYRPGSLRKEKLRAAIFEPNISPIKMGIIPLFICEELERRRPELLASVRFLNGSQMMAAKTFECMVEGLDITSSSKLTVSSREYFADVMKSNANAVISHQIDVGQNYLYLDALYGGYPLIHNSRDFADAGYYYNSSDVAEAVELIEEVLETHDSELEAYDLASRRTLAAVDPVSLLNRDAYARRLLSLTIFQSEKLAVTA